MCNNLLVKRFSQFSFHSQVSIQFSTNFAPQKAERHAFDFARFSMTKIGVQEELGNCRN